MLDLYDLRYVEITRLLQCIFLCNYVSALHLTPSYSPLQSLFCLAQMNFMYPQPNHCYKD